MSVAPARTVVSNCWATRGDDVPCRPRYFLLMLYPTGEALRRAARAYRRGDSDSDWDRTDGCFHPARMTARYDRRRRAWIDTTGAFSGVMRLHAQRMTPEVVAHEATHAALHITRLHDWAQPEHTGTADLGDACGPPEEDFAYLLGGIVDVVTERVVEYRRLLKR